jgi:peptidyl-prolyl cis-trans isomerase SurA
MRYLITFFALFFASQAFSQSYSLVAEVNGEAITNTQLNKRVDIIMSSSAIPQTDENREKIYPQALELLINEALQNQDAKARGIALADKEKEFAIKDLEQKNNLQPGGFKDFISSKDISYDAVMDQIYAGLLWRKVIERAIRPRIVVADYEVDQKKVLNASKPKVTQAELYEIIIPIEYGDKEASKEKAFKVYNEAKSADNFSALAKQYSAGKTGKNGGYVGTMEVDKLYGPVKEIVSKTKAGGITEPKLIDDSFYTIIKVADKKTIDPSDTKSVKEQIIQEKIELEARKYVKELRQRAFIRKY